ncbi:MAG: hypothetical protein WDN69_03650 [Aliidongia sp.]
MPTFKVAHIREQGQDMIIFPLDSAFGSQSSSEQSRTLAALEFRANAAGLAGQAVAVWESGNRMYFLGPQPWHPFLRSISMAAVWASVNQEISWAE